MDNLEQEKSIKGGIVYRADMLIYSNLFPAPLNLGGDDFVHLEQIYQYTKACHHKDTETAESLNILS